MALLVLIAILGGLAWLVLGGGFDRLATGGSEESSQPVVEEPVDVSLDELVDRMQDNGDGTVTVSLSEGETGGLMRRALTRRGEPTLDDLTVDLQEPDGSAPGQMQIAGRLPERDLPVTAVVDLDVDAGEVQPSVRGVKVGPFPVPAGLAADLNEQLQQVGLLADQGIAVDDLETTDGELSVTGRRD